MGATQSKTSEPVIFYNQSSPLQFSQPPVTDNKKTVNLESNEKIEELVRERVAEELKRVQYQNEAVNQQNYGELAKKNIENDHNSVAMTEDIEGMIKKLQRSAPTEIPASVSDSQEKLILCYKNNQSRPLDCWEEVEDFKNAVSVEQKKFVAAHQI